jgi:hypothetical protein
MKAWIRLSQRRLHQAFCSMKRAAMQRGVLKFEPKLLPSFDFLYENSYDGGAVTSTVLENCDPSARAG